MDEDRTDKGFRIERHANSKVVKMKDSVNIKTEDNVNLQRDKENIKLSQPSVNYDRHYKPHLTREDYQDSRKTKPKLVPMEGLDLLSNPKKTFNESSANESDYDSDKDSVISSYSSTSSDVKNTFGGNLFENSAKPDERKDYTSDSDDDYRKDHHDDHHHDEISVSSSDDEEEKQKTYEDIQREKQFLLFKLDRLEKTMRVKLPRRFTMASNIDDIKYEYEKLKRQRDVDKSIKFQRKVLMAISSGLEFLNNKFDPIDAKLDGWSESIMENIDDYDEVFEELHDKYAEKIQVAPEIKLLMMVGGSAFMFHLTNTLFKSNVPSLNEILKQNPDIMRSVSQAAANSMNNNQMGGNDPLSNMMKQGINMKAQQYNRSGMRGPTGVDDILNQLGGRRNDSAPNGSASDSESAHSVKHYSTNRKKRHAQNSKRMGINIDV